MGSARRHRRAEARPCQDVLKAFLVKRHISGLFFHVQIARHLTQAGFEVRQIARHDDHADVWVLKMRRGHVPVGREIEWSKKQVCLFLRRHGLRYPKKEVVVMVQGERIKAAFNWGRGQPGWLIYTKAKTERGSQ